MKAKQTLNRLLMVLTLKQDTVGITVCEEYKQPLCEKDLPPHSLRNKDRDTW